MDTSVRPLQPDSAVARRGAHRRRVAARPRRFVARSWTDLRRDWRSLDPLELSGLAGGVVFCAGGVVLLTLLVVSPLAGTARFSPLIGLTALAVGCAGLVLPWDRLPGRIQLVYPVVGFVLAALAAHEAQTGLAVVASSLALLFVISGLSQPLGTSFVLAPAAFAALWAATPAPRSLGVVTELVLEIGVAVAAGEVVALVMRSRRRNEQRIELLLDAVRELAHCTDENEGVRCTARLGGQLLDADIAAVYLADASGRPVYRQRAVVGHPSVYDLLPAEIDAPMCAGIAARLVRGELTVVANPWPAAGETAHGGRRIRTVAVLAMRDGDGRCIGLIVLGVLRAQWSLSTAAERAAEILAEQATTMFVRVRATRALERAAVTDPLTELANRRAIEIGLARLAPGDAVVVIDLDRFKVVNDRYGHAAGDDTLRDLARCLRDVARRADTIARYGGEEFLMILHDAGTEGASMLMGRLREAWGARERLTTFSAGIAVHHDGEEPGATVARADGALYTAKAAGRDQDAYAEAVISLS